MVTEARSNKYSSSSKKRVISRGLVLSNDGAERSPRAGIIIGEVIFAGELFWGIKDRIGSKVSVVLSTGERFVIGGVEKKGYSEEGSSVGSNKGEDRLVRLLCRCRSGGNSMKSESSVRSSGFCLFATSSSLSDAEGGLDMDLEIVSLSGTGEDSRLTRRVEGAMFQEPLAVGSKMIRVQCSGAVHNQQTKSYKL